MACVNPACKRASLGHSKERGGMNMSLKVDPNKNENVYNTDQDYAERPENFPKNKRKRRDRGGSK
jgi:hypothetical protein